MEDVAQIQPYQRLVSWNQLPDRRPRYRKRKKRSIRSVERKLYTLSRMADETHQDLVMKNAPIRLCVYQDDDNLVMDVVAIDQEKNKNHHFSREITDEKLPDLIRQIHKQQGLILNYSL